MKKIALFVFTITISLSSFSQFIEPQSSPFSYGITPLLTQTLKKDHFSSNIGVGLGMYANYKFGWDLSFASNLEYNNLRYKDEDNNFSYSSNDLSLKLGVKKAFQKLDNSAIILQYTPAFNFMYTQEYAGTNNTGEKQTNLIPKLNNQLSHGVYAGFELDFKSRSSMQFGYRHILKSSVQDNFIDPLPNNISLSYNISFSAKSNKINRTKQVKESFSKLSKDTLYVINRTCEDLYTLAQVDSIFNANYTFSEYRILTDDQVATVVKQDNVVHFIVIGKYYASKGDPLTNGIYLLDKNLNLTERPYPYYTSDAGTFLSSKLCFQSLSHMASIVQLFNKRLDWPAP